MFGCDIRAEYVDFRLSPSIKINLTQKDIFTLTHLMETICKCDKFLKLFFQTGFVVNVWSRPQVLQETPFDYTFFFAVK
jgi:hypothetical protein